MGNDSVPKEPSRPGIPDSDELDETSERITRPGGPAVALDIRPREEDEQIANLKASVQQLQDGDQENLEEVEKLGLLHLSRFERLGEAKDIEEAVINLGHAVSLTPDGHPSMAGQLHSLGNSLKGRFQRLGELGDLEKAVVNQERAVQLTREGHPEKLTRSNSLWMLLQLRFERLGALSDIETAITNQEHAAHLTPDEHPDKPSGLHNLGNSLRARFERYGELSDLEKAIIHQDRAVQLTPDGHLDKPSRLTNLGILYHHRFVRIGKLSDIENAIINKERAVQLSNESRPDKKRAFLHNLGTSLQKRYNLLGEVTDIEKAITIKEHALKLTPDNHPTKPTFLQSLANAFERRFQRFGKLSDIEKAIACREHAVRLTPDGHPHQPAGLNNLSCSFQIRFESLGQLADIEKAITANLSAIQLTPDDHPDKPRFLNDLGTSFRACFERFGEQADIEKAIIHHNQAIHHMPDGHPEKPIQLANFGRSLLIYFQSFDDTNALSDATRAFSESARMSSGRPSVRLQAAMQWAQCAHIHHDKDSLMAAYTTAFQLLPLASWLGLSISARHHALLDARSLPCDSAAAAFSVGDPEMALEWLEQGRSVVWGQLLRLRTPVDDLRDVNFDLAQKLSDIASSLEGGRASHTSFAKNEGLSSEQTTQKRHRQLAEEWESLVKEVQTIKGFERFLLPKQYSELRDASGDRPVVVLNASQYGCDALILSSPSEPPHHVHLGDLTYENAENLREKLLKILSHQGIRNRYTERHGGPVFSEESSGEEMFRHLLGAIWKLIVEPVIGHLTSRQTHSPTANGCLRIRWCPTGPLAFLPIHAAGIYNADGTASSSLADIAVSSYMPTLTAMLNKSQETQVKKSLFKLLAVIQPNTPGVNALPGTKEELSRIRKHLPSSSINILNGSDAKITQVMSGLDECSWVHLACHGVQDASDPMESGLLLEDGRLGLSQIIHKRLPHAEFAFLSACQTATGDERRPEEAIHLAAGMLLAGYKGVIATMWSIRDDDAPFVADQVYSRILTDGKPNGAHPEVALHDAIQELRKQNGSSFSSWVPFIYMGA